MKQTTLTAPLRKQLDKAVSRARDVAEEAAADAIRRLAVGEARPRVPLADEAAALRRRLRAHARALGDLQEENGSLTTARLQEAAAYEIWHRMLFSRFLVERGLLRHPELGAAMTLAELAEMAPEEGATDAWGLAERYAAATLPAVFKPDDPVLAMPLDPYHHKRLQELATGLDAAIFGADDALGWAYQFWRGAEKDRVNASEGKVGAAELPAVTQLFTEPYMVQFVLHNTLGAWWAGKVLARRPDLGSTAADEAALRSACALPGLEWEYLRFVRDPAGSGPWRPAAGTYPGWPGRAAEITMLDPCCGSGHFLIEALPILAGLRQEEEGLTSADAARAVLRDNLHGLELDGRCVQIAAFAVALAAWRIAGSPITLPNPHIAWVGSPPPLPVGEFAALAGGDADLERGLTALHGLFTNAPLMGSLIEPVGGDLVNPVRIAGVEQSLERLLARMGEAEPERAEGAIAARGMADASTLLARRWVLQVTNVPFRASGTLVETLRSHLETTFPMGKRNLATAMFERMLRAASDGGTVASVTPKEWLSAKSYRDLRHWCVSRKAIDCIAALGPRSFETISGEVVNVCLVVATPGRKHETASFQYFDAVSGETPKEKAGMLVADSPTQISFGSVGRRAHVELADIEDDTKLLHNFVSHHQGLATGDLNRFSLLFWEVKLPDDRWVYWQGSVSSSEEFRGLERVLLWEHGAGSLHAFNEENKAVRKNTHLRGLGVLRKQGVLVTQMGALPASLFSGERFDDTTTVLIPKDQSLLPALWAYIQTPEYADAIRRIDSSIKVPAATLTKAPFDIARWQGVAATKYPGGLPAPYSDDPTQWLFHGHPAHAATGTAVHVALARVAGYRWPAETNTGMRLSPVARDLIARAAALPEGDADGLLPLHAQGKDGALAERLRAMLAAAYGSRWSNALEAELVREADITLDKKAARDISLETWLRDRAFRQHCGLFHNRPFLWQVWDGLPDGFSAFLHYHRLSHATLQTLTYTVLGYWLTRAKHDGQTAHVEKASVLQQKLDAILQGESPYDIFVRWKPLAQQPLGWDPDLDDGVRMNIRPFVKAGVLRDIPNIRWTKDRGKDTASAPWYAVFNGDRVNDHHTSLSEKQASRAKP